MRPKGNILLVFYLFLFFIGTILLMGANAADQDPSLYGRGEEPPPVYDEGEPFELLNLCGVSKIRDNEQTEYTRNVESVLTAVVDEDQNTYLTKSCTPDQWLEIRFPGARKWVNFVEIQYTGKDDFKFEIFNFKGETQEINVISADLRGIFGSSKIKTIEFEPVRAKGIRWSWATAGSADQRINIYEISAWFYQPDPDDQVDSDLDDRVSGQKTVSETVPPAKLPPANAPVAKDGTLPDTKQTPGTIPDYGMGTGLPKGGKALLSEGFEGAWPPPGWTVIQTHTGTSHPIPSYWSQTDYTVHSGTYAAGLWWDYGHQDEWLITPAVLLDGACFLSFWTYGWEGSTHGDHYYVKVSTDGGTSWDVVFDLSELTLGDWNAWDYPYTIDLSAYSGQVVNIAFHAQDPPDNDGLWYIWVIDDVYLNPYPDPDPNDPTNWLLCETCDPIIGPPDITPLWNRISTRPGWCPGASHWCHLWVPPADWSGDFRRAAAGGGENSHVTGYTGMD